MPDKFAPVEVYYPADPKDSWRSGFVPYKTLKANTEEELAALLRIGWTRDKPN